MTKGRGRGNTLVRALAVLAALLAAWGVSRAVSAANRPPLPPPSRVLPTQDEQTAFEHGLAPELIPHLQKAIFELYRRYDPPYGVFAAMEPKTGRVLALVGYRKGGETDPSLPLKAIYPAASLIKVVTAAAALEKGAISPEKEISYRGGIYRITRKGLHTHGGRGIPTMTLEEAIAKSANSVFGKVGVKYVGSETLGEFMEKFGFGQRIPFGLPVEVSNGLVPSAEYHLARTAAGFGEGYVSPLHMAIAGHGGGRQDRVPVGLEPENAFRMVRRRCAGRGRENCGRRPRGERQPREDQGELRREGGVLLLLRVSGIPPARLRESPGEEKRARRGKETRSKKGGRREERVEEALTGGQAGARVSPVVRPASHPPLAVVSMPPSRRPFPGLTIRWNSHG